MVSMFASKAMPQTAASRKCLARKARHRTSCGGIDEYLKFREVDGGALPPLS